MNSSEYLKLSKELQDLAKIIPLNWGAIQNDNTDRNINMFSIQTFSELELKILGLDEGTKNYLRRRWFLWKCSQCDEYLFCINGNVKANPNTRDQTYDIEFNENINMRFDIKSTVIPRDFRQNIDSVISDPSRVIDFYYKSQSKGVRNNIQNRLFIIHHSFRNYDREMYLRCYWAHKENVFAEYASKINLSSNFYEFNGAKADVIFILENTDKTFSHSYFAIK